MTATDPTPNPDTDLLTVVAMSRLLIARADDRPDTFLELLDVIGVEGIPALVWAMAANVIVPLRAEHGDDWRGVVMLTSTLAEAEAAVLAPEEADHDPG